MWTKQKNKWCKALHDSLACSRISCHFFSLLFPCHSAACLLVMFWFFYKSSTLSNLLKYSGSYLTTTCSNKAFITSSLGCVISSWSCSCRFFLTDGELVGRVAAASVSCRFFLEDGELVARVAAASESCRFFLTDGELVAIFAAARESVANVLALFPVPDMLFQGL